MIDHLSSLVDNFPGAANQIRCFNHILNLVAKSILRQFDAPKKDRSGRTSKDDENLLAGLAQELDNETDNEDEEDLTDYNDDDRDNEDGREGMSREQVVELEESLVPVRLMLAKVRQFQTQSLSIIDSYYNTFIFSFEPLQTQSRTLPLSSYLNGTQNSRSLASASE
jgi:hypothetical protein